MGDLMDKRTLIKKRISHPTVHYYGNVTSNTIYTLSKLHKWMPETLHNAKNLRSQQVDDSYTDMKLVENYSQYDIQSKLPDSDDKEEYYIVTPEDFKDVEAEVSYLLKSPVCRLRYSVLQKNDSLEYHIDQPGMDRFVMVIEGDHVINIKTKHGVHRQPMLPGEVWYINSNWEHSVDNIGSNKRLALLGCFEYNKN